MDEEQEALIFRGKYIDYLEDPAGTLTFSEVSSDSFKNRFTHGIGLDVERNRNLSSAYWVRMQVVNNADQEKQFVSELYDFRIDYYEYYVVKNGKVVSSKKGGAQDPFYQKRIVHKNFVDKLPLQHNEEATIYYKIKSSEPVSFIGMIRSFEKLLAYSNNEYFSLALFYGVIISMMLYNLFIFFAVKDLTYLYYVFYVMSVGIYSLSQDGLGFQYLWYNYPSLNHYIFQVSSCAITVWIVMYAVSFLGTRNTYPSIGKYIAFILGIRIALTAVTFYFPVTVRWVDLIIMLSIYLVGVSTWMRGNRIARFYVYGFSIFFVGYLLTFLTIFSFIGVIPLIIYSLNLGIICEMLMFSFALSDRFKIINEQNIKNQKMLVSQAEEKELLVKEINRKLEEEVEERTKLLEEKNQELDVFVYKSSHDIKGPLKSILGLAMVGLQKVDDPVAKAFLSRVLENSRKLDKVTDGLLSIINFKQLEVKVEAIDFEGLLSGILAPIKENPKYDFIKKEVEIRQDKPFFSDKKILEIIIKDIIEAAVLFADPSYPNPLLRVKITLTEGTAQIHLFGTGKGIPQKSIEEMFNPFSSFTYINQNSALGLYMLKLHVEKIKGTMNFSSTENVGAFFDLDIPDLQSTHEICA